MEVCMIDIDKIVLEWASRVEDRKPNAKNSYHRKILKEVLQKLDHPEIFIEKLLENLRNEPKKSFVIEGLNKVKYKNLSDAALAMGKSKPFDMFLKNASSEAAGQIQPTLDILEKEQKALESKNKGLKHSDSKYKIGTQSREFLTALASVSDVTKLVSYFPAKGIMKDIFNLEGPLGKGEMWISVIRKINNVCAELNKMGLAKIEKSLGPSSAELIEGIKGVLKYKGEVEKGAFSERDYSPSYHKFLSAAKNFGSSEVQGYTQIEMTGPNRAPVIRSIVPLDQASIKTKGPLELELLENSPEDSAELIKTKLNSLKYVRADDPVQSLKQGQQDSITVIAKHYSGVTFMIFRSGTIDFVDPNKFYYKTSTQGKVKITYGKANPHV